jgi:hypothetical protein
MSTVQRLIRLVGLVLIGVILAACNTPSQGAAPAAAHLAAPEQVAAKPSLAKQQLAALKVETPHPTSKYDRAKFRHWIPQGHGCDTRETVLKQQGAHVTVDKNCSPVSGSWTSPYDNETWTQATDVDIDHMVPLGEAWASGAYAWTPQRREDFANDLSDPQLIAVTDNLNQQKGDKTPDKWKPPLVSYWPTYAASLSKRSSG